MTYCFDSSAIGDLYAEPDCAAIVRGLLSANTVLVTKLNVLEALKHGSTTHREGLLKLLRQLAPPGRAVLMLPNDLLDRAAKAFAERESRFEAGSSGARAVLDGEIIADDKASGQAITWTAKLEEPFKKAHEDARIVFQSLFNEVHEDRPKSRAGAIRYICSNDDLVHTFVGNSYKAFTGTALERRDVRELIKAFPEWGLHWLGWIHEWYERAVQPTNYSAKRKPGTLDLWFGIYLPLCDRFVTSDNGQYRALRMINVLNKKINTARQTQVIKYKEFRRCLLVGERPSINAHVPTTFTRFP